MGNAIAAAAVKSAWPAMCTLSGVAIEMSIHHDPPVHPVDRMIRVHQRSLKLSKRLAEPCCCVPPAGVSDAGQCRIIVNALRREIDRLLRGIDRFDWRGPAIDNRRHVPGAHDCSPPSSTSVATSSAHGSKRIYAPAALGTPLSQGVALNSLSSSAPPPPAQGLIDILA